MPNYRVVVQFDPERKVFTARAPELEHCSGEGATRAEAVSKVEEEIEATLGNMKESGTNPPPGLDDGGDDPTLTGDLTAKVSRSLHRDLAWQARLEGLEIGQLVSELLAGAIDARRQQRGRRPNPQDRSGNTSDQGQRGGGDRGPRRDDRRQGGGQQGQGGRYHAIMDDRATFLEYVRGLEKQQQGPGGGQQGNFRGGGRGDGGGGRGRRGPGPGGRPPGGGQGGQGGPAGGGASGGSSGGSEGDSEG
jgi:predicted RNase H-like HicB family nuclease